MFIRTAIGFLRGAKRFDLNFYMRKTYHRWSNQAGKIFFTIGQFAWCIRFTVPLTQQEQADKVWSLLRWKGPIKLPQIHVNWRNMSIIGLKEVFMVLWKSKLNLDTTLPNALYCSMNICYFIGILWCPSQWTVSCRAGKKYEIQLPNRPVDFSFQLPTQKCYLLNRHAMFMPHPLDYLISTVYDKYPSLLFSSYSLTYFNCFWLEIIADKTTEAYFTKGWFSLATES